VGISHSIYFQTQGTIQKNTFNIISKCKITKICCCVSEQPTRQQQQQQQQQQ
jgi:hypothetical protein